MPEFKGGIEENYSKDNSLLIASYNFFSYLLPESRYKKNMVFEINLILLYSSVFKRG